MMCVELFDEVSNRNIGYLNVAGEMESVCSVIWSECNLVCARLFYLERLFSSTAARYIPDDMSLECRHRRHRGTLLSAATSSPDQNAQVP